jgi:hypothetical protein
VIVITGSIYDDHEFFEFVLVPLLKLLTKNSIKIKKKEYCGTIEIHISDKKLFSKIKSFDFPIGKKGPSIFISEYFYRNNLVKYVIQGFFSTDGSLVITKNPNKFYPRIEGNGISKELIKQIANYLISIGMKGYFYEAKRKKKDLRWDNIHQTYRFQFNGKDNLVLFNDLIGFVNPKHKKRSDIFLEYSKKYDDSIKGIPSSKQRIIGKEVNKIFYS